MRLTEFAVRNPAFMLVAFGLLTAIGLTSWQQIPRTEDPVFDISAYRVIAVYTGADALEVERQLVEPIEDAINTLDDVKVIAGSADDSLGAVRVEFVVGIDTDRTFDAINREIDLLRPDFPDGVQSVEVERINPGLVNIVQLGLVSEQASWQLLEDTAEDLKDRIETVDAVKEVEIQGLPARELRVELDLGRLGETGIAAMQVYQAVAGRTGNVPGGSVDVGQRRFNLRSTGDIERLDQLRDTVVVADGARVVRVGDVARVSWDYGPERHTARLDGKRAVWVVANQREKRNAIDTRAAIWEVLDAFESELPRNIELVRAFDQSRNVAARLGRLMTDFLIALIAVSFTLLPLGMRSAGLVMVSIPLSLAMGLSALHFTGFTLNQLSIAGFVVALGLLVDDSIVVTENIARYLRLGHDRTEAALLATRQITLAILGATGTLLFAFVPLLALPGEAGNFIRGLPLAVVFTVAASLLVALTIIPFLASRVLPRTAEGEGNAVLRTVMRFIHGVYRPMLKLALRFRWTTMVLSLLAVVATVATVPGIVGLAMFPKADTPQALVQVTLPDGANRDATDRVLREVEAILLEQAEVDHVMANLGRGNPQIYYNIFQREYAPNFAEIFLQIEQFDGALTPRFYERMRTRFDDIAGADIVLREFENGPPTEAPIALRVLGRDLDELRRLAAQIEDVMRDTPGVRDIVNGQRRQRIDLKLDVDEQRIGQLGVDPLALDTTVRIALSGLPAGEVFNDRGDDYPVVVRAPLAGSAARLDALDGLHVAADNGAQVPLGQLADVRLAAAPARIEREQRSRAAMVTAFTEPGYNTEALTWDIVERVRALDWPPGYELDIAGEVESREEAFGGLGTAIIIAVFGVLAVLVLEFGSFRSMLIVAGVVPLGVMGGLLALLLTNNPVGFTSMIGFIALIGIEIKNSILLVDFTNLLRRQGKPLMEAVIEAGEIRFLPILLTTATAVAGLLALALADSALYSPLAWVIIGGLVSSTLIGRLVTPVMYTLLPPAITPHTGDDDLPTHA
ncbi:efflux RND transporter permease subunit [Algiphilus sp.]|uniref:efflux RND transporter permease subunit n=1 Tax=Algiphilus sp. TaxID=1872431 RepID=UPI0025C2981C|nr:efflux RND transporter permease subunit [Algiphilus sp.]MCK5770505.1 efflux RND transporter permease subunit [Algiphilus sp.]